MYLTSNLLKKWNKNYRSILTWLLSIGLLEESGHSYSPHHHVCKHYFINTDIFEEEPETEEESETDEEFDDSLYV